MTELLFKYLHFKAEKFPFFTFMFTSTISCFLKCICWFQIGIKCYHLDNKCIAPLFQFDSRSGNCNCIFQKLNSFHLKGENKSCCSSDNLVWSFLRRHFQIYFQRTFLESVFFNINSLCRSTTLIRYVHN